MVNDATPADSVPVPSVVAPSLNVTVPVAPVPTTVAVNVTNWPTLLGLAEDVMDIVVVAVPIDPLTVCVAVCAGLPLSVSPDAVVESRPPSSACRRPCRSWQLSVVPAGSAPEASVIAVGHGSTTRHIALRIGLTNLASSQTRVEIIVNVAGACVPLVPLVTVCAGLPLSVALML